MLEYGLALLAGLLGGLHCAGMCGPIVMSCVPIGIAGVEGYGVRTQASALSAWTPHAFYNSGRVVSYSMLGAMAGLAGAGALLDASFQSWVSITLGAMMVIVGLSQLSLLPKLPKRATTTASTRSRFIRDILGADSYESRFALGFITPLLPCGLLYAMVMRAAASASPFSGAALMGAFALGSAPALLVIGLFAGLLQEKARKWGTRFGGRHHRDGTAHDSKRCECTDRGHRSWSRCECPGDSPRNDSLSPQSTALTNLL